jgi:hypothetical protein
MPALPRPETLRGAIATPGAQQRFRQATIPRPGHHLHRTLHRNIDWWVASDAPFEPLALQVGKSLRVGKSLQVGKPSQNAKDDAAPARAFNYGYADSCSMHEGFIRRIVHRY